MARVVFTEAFFNDTFANESFFGAVERGKVYRARKVPERQAYKTNIDYMVNVKGDFLTKSLFGFESWHNIVPVRLNEITIVGAR